ncbi:unnamed protein product [Parascedosporium putredinis]|uniref:Circumsporozoite protein n=1 Tax=Parascedosporium putredinis TaxID=1442378 RepID=A0A9P1HB37_9PEZI|nr:unnamed protein product [Parascedosporium putredinis]CAI8003316.1 unnamed protein product [Parascedosporium putredinis]
MSAMKLAIISIAIAFALGNFGNPGAAGTLSGQVPGVLLAAASPCAKLSLADDIVSQLGDDPQVIAAAIGNANSAQSVQNPFDATGISVAELAIQQGFSNFKAVDAAGNAVDLAGLGAGNAGAGAGAGAGNAGAGNADAGNAGNNAAAAADAGNNAGAGNGAAAGNGAVDFGTCDPTIFRAGGLGGRPDTEFTFQSNEPTISANQQEALNPDIIVNRICDDLNNICGANDAAIAACRDAQQLLKDQGLGVGGGDAVVTAFNDAILAA